MSKKTPELSLVGRCFMIFGEDKKVQYQGVVRGQVGSDHYLCQFYEWLAGEPGILAVLSIEEMSNWSRAEGGFMFFEDDTHMRGWLQQNPLNQYRT